MLGSYAIGLRGTYAVDRMNFTPASRDRPKPCPFRQLAEQRRQPQHSPPRVSVMSSLPWYENRQQIPLILNKISPPPEESGKSSGVLCMAKFPGVR